VIDGVPFAVAMRRRSSTIASLHLALLRGECRDVAAAMRAGRRAGMDVLHAAVAEIEGAWEAIGGAQLRAVEFEHVGPVEYGGRRLRWPRAS